MTKSKKKNIKFSKSRKIRGGTQELKYTDLFDIYQTINRGGEEIEFEITFVSGPPMIKGLKLYGLYLFNIIEDRYEYEDENPNNEFMVWLSVDKKIDLDDEDYYNGALILKPIWNNTRETKFELDDDDDAFKYINKHPKNNITAEQQNLIFESIRNHRPYLVTIEKHKAKQKTIDTIYSLNKKGYTLNPDDVRNLYEYL